MAFVNNSIYRIKNKAYEGDTLNVFGTNAASTGRNVCLYPDTPSDIMQKWVLKDCNAGTFKLCSAVNQDFVLDRSDGTLASSYNNNAHLCKISSTSNRDSEIIFEYVYGNLYRIKLANSINGRTLYLTAAGSPGSATPASRISTAAALIGKAGGLGNVYWADRLEDDNDTFFIESHKQMWIIEGAGSSGGQSGGDTPRGNLTLTQLKSKFPHGKYWNHVGMTNNNQDGYTSTQCPSHSNENTCNAFELNGVKYSWQCMGFAEKCGYDSTGSNPRANGVWTTYTESSSLDNLKAGDIVRYYNSGIKHSIFITSVSGDTVTYGDCNATGKRCQIRWGATITKQTLSSNFIHLRCAPFTLK